MTNFDIINTAINATNGNEFTEEDILIGVCSMSEWSATNQYVYNAIRHNIRNGFIVKTGSNPAKYRLIRTIVVSQRKKISKQKTNRVNNSRIISYPKPLATDSYVLRYLKEVRGIVADSNNIVELTEHNSDIVEDNIPLGIPKNYIPGNRRNIARAYLPEAQSLYIKENDNSHRYNREFIKTILTKIDNENSTNDYSKHHSEAINFYSDYICNPINDFWGRNQRGEVSLVDDMINSLETYRRNNNMNNYSPRSLTSKICKYINNWEFDGDSYYINDSVVRSILPYYLNKYAISFSAVKNDISYTELYELLSMINTYCPTLSKSRLDHIMWYCYRNWGLY